MPSFLRWSESTITFDQTDHPESVLHLRRYLLVVNPIIGTKWLTKVLMDGGSELNIKYAETLDAMGIDRSRIWPTGAPFHDNVPRKVITVDTSFQRTYECEVECYEHAMMIVTSKELMTIREQIIEEAPDPKCLARSFKPVVGAKEVLIDPSGSEGKMVRIGTMVSSK
ncbi:uncharacterized protein [Miscanthus floridulus]|uniref:uncharacterized protein n=1 Tax=Miscanthus floridulus TaxID=154761 RepID=UPI0034589EC3